MKHLSPAEIVVIKACVLRGDLYHEIASDYRINQSRLSDLRHGRIFADVRPAHLWPIRPRFHWIRGRQFGRERKKQD